MSYSHLRVLPLLKVNLPVENLPFNLFPGRVYGFHRRKNEPLCPWRCSSMQWFRTKLGASLFGDESHYLAALGPWASYFSVPRSLHLYIKEG